MLIRNAGARNRQRGHMPNRDSAASGPSSSAATSQPVVGQSAPAITNELAQPWAQATAPVDQAGAAGPNAAAHHPQLGPDLQALIGHQLRAVYHEALNEPVPDRFVRLLEELAAKTADRP
jgi:hypothetical protein